MTTTASSTIVNRTARTRAAAAMMALAYLRNLREGDSVRASVVLAEFQRFWSVQRSVIVPEPPPFSTGIPPDLRATGMLDQDTQNAVMYVLWSAGGIISDATAQTRVEGAGALLAHVYPRLQVTGNSAFWAGYRVSRVGPPQDAGVALGVWSFGFVEGIDDEADLMAELARPEAVVPGHVTHLGPEIDVFASPLRRKTATLWPWVVAAAAAGLLYAGFVYRKKGRR